MRPIGCLTALPTSPSRGKEWVVFVERKLPEAQFRVPHSPKAVVSIFDSTPREERKKERERFLLKDSASGSLRRTLIVEKGPC
jgi:hypothetical protein